MVKEYGKVPDRALDIQPVPDTNIVKKETCITKRNPVGSMLKEGIDYRVEEKDGFRMYFLSENYLTVDNPSRLHIIAK